jgi:hypothetical protein
LYLLFKIDISVPARISLLFLSFLFVSITSIAQTLPVDLWYVGKAVLVNGDTMRGLIKYDAEDFLQVRHDNISEIFHAEKITYFEIFDQTAKRSREFYPLPYLKNNKKPIFFELLSKGKLTLLSRERSEAITYSQSAGFLPPKIHRIMSYQYYLVDLKGVRKISSKQRKVIRLMNDRKDSVNQVINWQHLSFRNKYDVKKIFDYYNSLFYKQTFNAKTSDLSYQR